MEKCKNGFFLTREKISIYKQGKRLCLYTNVGHVLKGFSREIFPLSRWQTLGFKRQVYICGGPMYMGLVMSCLRAKHPWQVKTWILTYHDKP